MLVSLKDNEPWKSGNDCPVCGTCGPSRLKAVASFGEREFRYFECRACGSLVSVPPPATDYSEHTSNDASARDYIELNCSIDNLATNVMRIIGPRRGGRMIDVGCGFGFACDIARRVAGWEVVGVEPSAYGALGAETLGLNIVRDYIDENHPVAQVKYDLFHASEVIEHVDDPRRFARLAKKLLKPDGVAVMTTPLAEALQTDIPDGFRYAMLSPNAHGFLCSRSALLRLLSEAGFRHVRQEMIGTSIAVYASDSPIELYEVDAPALTIQYARAILDDAPQRSPLRDGMIFRAFAASVSRGQFDTADQFLAHVEDLLTYTPRTHASYDDFMADYHAFIGPLYFYHGAYCMIHKQDFARARRSLLLGHELCRERAALSPQTGQVDASLVWPCALYAGIASFHAGDRLTAKHLFDIIVEQPVDATPAVTADVKEQAMAQRATVLAQPERQPAPLPRTGIAGSTRSWRTFVRSCSRLAASAVHAKWNGRKTPPARGVT